MEKDLTLALPWKNVVTIDRVMKFFDFVCTIYASLAFQRSESTHSLGTHRKFHVLLKHTEIEKNLGKKFQMSKNK